VVGVVFAAPVAPMIGRWRDRVTARPRSGRVALTLDFAGLGVLLWAAAAFLAAGTYNPFIYFRF